ncbi:MAG TPA: Type 1 glutamine amidotransferase-like domain-containing protein [Candidatus Paceibacterota bacterium]
MKTLFLTSAFKDVIDKFKENVSVTPGMKVAFIPTASDTYETKPWVDNDRQALINLGLDVEDLDIKDKNQDELYDFLKNKDIIFVAGGNTFYLLYYVKQSGFYGALSKLLDEGKIYIGSSAGSVLVGPNIEPVKTMDDPQDAPELKYFEGLGLIDMVLLPHYGKEKYEQQYQDIIKEWSDKFKLQLLKDDEVILVKDGEVKILD